MDSLFETAADMLDIERRQDDVLRQLAELERQLDQVLAEHMAATSPPTVARPSGVSSPASMPSVKAA